MAGDQVQFRPHPISWTGEQIDRVWAYYGSNPAYDEAYFSRHSGAAICRFVRPWIDLRGREVVDFGCGRGHLLEHLLKKGARCWGIDSSEETARLTNERLRPNPLLRDVVWAPNLPVPLPGCMADVVFLVEVIEHLPDGLLAGTLAEASRLLRVGGVLIVTTPHAENLDREMVRCPECGCTFHRWQHLRAWDGPALRRTLEEHGLATLHCGRTNFFEGRRLGARLRRLYHQLAARPKAQPHLIYIGTRQ